MIKVIDLFSGCGGFSVGFKKTGYYNVIKAVEFDKVIAKSYAYNHPETQMINQDIKNIDNENYFLRNEADVIIGGPPCQGFSMAGARIRNGFIDDERNYLFRHYFNIVKLVRPKIFIMENVKGILNLKNGSIFEEIKRVFSDSNNFDGDRYFLNYVVVNAKDYGVPQSRERVIIVGVLNQNIDLTKFISETKNFIQRNDQHFFEKFTVKDAIGNLPLPTTDGVCHNIISDNHYLDFLKSDNGITYNHIATKHSQIAINRIKQIKIDENFKVLEEEINSVHSGAYGRLNYDGIAQTITTRFDTPSGGKFIHPEQDRTLTPREAARIQGFPDSFKFIGNKTSICKQIGNAVPIKISYFYGMLVRRILDVCFNQGTFRETK